MKSSRIKFDNIFFRFFFSLYFYFFFFFKCKWFPEFVANWNAVVRRTHKDAISKLLFILTREIVIKRSCLLIYLVYPFVRHLLVVLKQRQALFTVQYRCNCILFWYTVLFNRARQNAANSGKQLGKLCIKLSHRNATDADHTINKCFYFKFERFEMLELVCSAFVSETICISFIPFIFVPISSAFIYPEDLIFS